MKIPIQITKYSYQHLTLNIIQNIFDWLSFFLPKSKKKLPVKIKKALVVKPDHIGDTLLNHIAFKEFNQEHEVDYLIHPDSEGFLQKEINYQSYIMFSHFMHNRSNTSKLKKLKLFFKDITKLRAFLKNNQYDIIFLARSDPGSLLFFIWLFTDSFKIGFRQSGLPDLLNHCIDIDIDNHEINNQTKLLELIYKKEVSLDRDPIDALPSPIDVYLFPNSGNLIKEFDGDFWLKICRKFNLDSITIIGNRNNDKICKKLENNGITVKNLSQKVSLAMLLDLIDHADTCFAVESFPAHYAAYKGKKTFVFNKQMDKVKRWRAIGENTYHFHYDDRMFVDA